MITKSIIYAPVLGAALSLSGLGHAQTGAGAETAAPATQMAPAATGSTAQQAPAKAVTDPEIIGILEAANQGEIDEAKVAKKISKSKPVKDFAEMMILEHEQVQKDVKLFAKKVKMTPADSDTKSALKKTVADNIKTLKRVSGKEHDRRYMADQVAMHQNLLDQIDSTLLPGAQDAELKAILTKVRASVAQHLESAKTLQNTIGVAG